MTRQEMQDHFHRMGRFLDEDERERFAGAALEDPGAKIIASGGLSDELLGSYHAQLSNPASAEDERALRKADLHDRRCTLHAAR